MTVWTNYAIRIPLISISESLIELRTAMATAIM